MRDEQTTEQTVKIELLSRWKQYNSEFYELCGVLNSQGSFQSMYSDIFPSLGSWYQFFVLGPCKVMVSLEMFIYEAYVYV